MNWEPVKPACSTRLIVVVIIMDSLCGNRVSPHASGQARRGHCTMMDCSSVPVYIMHSTIDFCQYTLTHSLIVTNPNWNGAPRHSSPIVTMIIQDGTGRSFCVQPTNQRASRLDWRPLWDPSICNQTTCLQHGSTLGILIANAVLISMLY